MSSEGCRSNNVLEAKNQASNCAGQTPSEAPNSETVAETSLKVHSSIYPQRMRLNDDVLCEVMYHTCRRSDMLAMMRTCQTLYSAGAIQLPRFPVDLKLDNMRDFSTESFCLFMHADISRRTRYFRELTFNANDWYDCQITASFAKVLLNARYLDTLHIHAAHRLVFLTDISKAISSLPSLRHLTLQGCENEYSNILLSTFLKKAHFLPCLSSLRLEFEPPYHPNAVDLEAFPCSSNLTALTLRDGRLCSSDDQYFKMRELAKWGSYAWTTDVASWIHSFPNLRSLKHLHVKHRGSDWTPANDQELRRVLNRIVQAVHKWDCMQLISGDLVDIYFLAPISTVRNLKVGILYRASLHMLDPLVCDTVPFHLVLNHWIDHELFHLDDVPKLLKEIHPETKHVTLRFHLSERDPVHNIDDLTNGVLTLLAFLPGLARLKVKIKWAECRCGAACKLNVFGKGPDPESVLVDISERDPDGQVEHSPTYDSLQQMDHAAFARRVMQASRSVEYVGIAMSGTISAKSDFGIVEVEQGNREVQELPAGHGIEMELEEEP